ncbi:DUF6083 domain-containing protein [Streptomyces sp. NPDC006446]|uniref:DUF6083 domain-containing protein n=1 Tax=Streptomyces sp. NPDC006446 TaxID=3154301 RepID=UPI0033B0900E
MGSPARSLPRRAPARYLARRDNSHAQHRPDGDAGRKLDCLLVEIPAFHRRHLSGGVAYCHGDGSAWCRIPHRALCPGRTPTAQTGP